MPFNNASEEFLIKTLSNITYVFLSDTRCLIQDVLLLHCDDKRMARRCTRSSLPNYVVMMSYHWNMRGKHQCRQRQQSECFMFIHLSYVSQIHGNILIS
jgi:hypothetical protein